MPGGYNIYDKRAKRNNKGEQDSDGGGGGNGILVHDVAKQQAKNKTGFRFLFRSGSWLTSCCYIVRNVRAFLQYHSSS